MIFLFRKKENNKQQQTTTTTTTTCISMFGLKKGIFFFSFYL